MRKTFSARAGGVAVIALALAACGTKRTGPDAQSSATAPDLATPMPAASDDPEAARALVDFAGADSDHDGRITSAEYASATTRMFSALDGDGDGTITLAELEASFKALKVPGPVSAERTIAEADNDGDGKLTLAEFIARSNGRFAQMDLNHDGVLDPDEWAKGHRNVGAPATGAAAAPSPSPSARH